MTTTRDGNNWSVGYTYRADGLIASRAKSVYVLAFGKWVEIFEQPTYFLHDGGEPVLEMDLGSNYSTVSAINVRGPDGLVARRQGGNWIYYEFDAQGSVSQRLNASGTVLSSSVYDAYGAETNSGTPTDPFGYNAQWGYWLDRDTGMYLCQARWYDPVTARWVTRDPIGYAGGANLYGYCGGGPVGWADPSGLQFQRVAGWLGNAALGIWDTGPLRWFHRVDPRLPICLLCTRREQRPFCDGKVPGLVVGALHRRYMGYTLGSERRRRRHPRLDTDSGGFDRGRRSEGAGWPEGCAGAIGRTKSRQKRASGAPRLGLWAGLRA